MGKRRPMRGGWTKNVGTLIDDEIEVRAICDTCTAKYVVVDLAKVAEAKGREYSLWNKRTHCRLTAGCVGYIRFFCGGRGWMQRMGD